MGWMDWFGVVMTSGLQGNMLLWRRGKKSFLQKTWTDPRVAPGMQCPGSAQKF